MGFSDEKSRARKLLAYIAFAAIMLRALIPKRNKVLPYTRPVSPDEPQDHGPNSDPIIN